MVEYIPADEEKSNRLLKKGTKMYPFSRLFWIQEQANLMEYSKCITPRVLQSILKVQ